MRLIEYNPIAFVKFFATCNLLKNCVSQKSNLISSNLIVQTQTSVFLNILFH